MRTFSAQNSNQQNSKEQMYQPSKNGSPYNNRSDYCQSPEQELHESLDKYLSVSVQENYTDKLRKEIVITEIQSINSDLSNMCKDRCGDLTTGSDKAEPQWVEIEKTIKLVKSLISMIHKDAETKKELTVKLRRNEQQIARQTNINEKFTRQKRNLQKQKQSLQLKIKSLERQFKEDIQKVKKDKEDAEKKFQQIANKENHYKNEMRKNQQIIAELQQKIKNKNSERIDKNTVKNTFEIIEQVKKYGPSLILSNSENQFNKFFMNNFEAKHRAIVEENQYLKECLKNVYRQLHELLQVKKEIIKKRKGFESALDSDAFEIDNIKPETFNLPKEYSQESMERLNENLQKFKQAIKLNDLVNDKVQDQKVQCISNVKNLLSNYKQIVQSQDKLINRVVLKSKQFKSNEMASIDNKYSRLEQDELQKSKRFLQEQRQILMNRNKELELTRKAMKNTIKKAEEEKKMFNKKRIETSEQLQILKKNIEKLPAMVEQEISSMM